MNIIRTTLAAAAAVASVLSANVASADQYQRWVNVVNTSGSAIYSVHISDVGRGDWAPTCSEGA